MTRHRSRRSEIMVGGLVLLAAAVFTWMSVQIGALRSLGRSVTVIAVFDDAAGLLPDSAVKVAGVKVGTVDSLTVEGERAAARLVIDADVGLKKNARARVRARSLLGEKYVALYPGEGDAPPLADGDRITDTSSGVEIDQLVNRLGPLLSKVEPDDMAALIASAGKVLDAAGDRAPEILARVDRILARFEEVAEIAPELKRDVPALLEDARGAVKKVEGSLQRVDDVVARLDGLVTRADDATDGLPKAMDDVQAMLDELRPGITDLSSALQHSDDLAKKLERVLDNVEELDAEEIRRLLREEGVLVRVRPPQPDKK